MRGFWHWLALELGLQSQEDLAGLLAPPHSSCAAYSLRQGREWFRERVCKSGLAPQSWHLDRWLHFWNFRGCWCHQPHWVVARIKWDIMHKPLGIGPSRYSLSFSFFTYKARTTGLLWLLNKQMDPKEIWNYARLSRKERFPLRCAPWPGQDHKDSATSIGHLLHTFRADVLPHALLVGVESGTLFLKVSWNYRLKALERWPSKTQAANLS